MSETKFKHVSLTHFMRRNCNPKMVANILSRCDVSPRVGCLPPQLVPLIKPKRRASVANAFGQCLENFFINNIKQIKELTSDMDFYPSDIIKLFKTKCVITARGVRVCGVGSWSGGFGVVCKVTFPEIHAEYALKYFLVADKAGEHGAAFEIPTAFAANHAEPADNCPIYMASLTPGCEFMLSKWAGDVSDGFVRPNQYDIFVTNQDEVFARNWRCGRRIDYGETFQTDYGRASYPVRKLFRKIMRAAELGYDAELEYLYNTLTNHQDRKNLTDAMKMARVSTFMNDKYSACDVIERSIKSHQR